MKPSRHTVSSDHSR